MEVNTFISTLNRLITGVLDDSPVYTIGSITGDFTPFTLNTGSAFPFTIEVPPVPDAKVILTKSHFIII